MASITGMLKATFPIPPSTNAPGLSSGYLRRWGGGGSGGGGEVMGLVVECSSRPQKKATAHHMKTRPKKSQPWDIRRKGPTVYPPLPPLPPDWTLVVDPSSSSEDTQKQLQEESAAPSL